MWIYLKLLLILVEISMKFMKRIYYNCFKKIFKIKKKKY